MLCGMDEPRVGLAQLLVGLSLVADVGMGLEPGEAARAAVIAARLAEDVGAGAPSDVYYATLLQHIGCTAYAHEAAAILGGDEIAVKSAAMRTDFAHPRDVLIVYLPNLAPQAGMLTRLRAAGVAAARSRQLRGDAIPLAARIAQVAVYASLFDRLGGAELAVATLRRRAGRSLDAA